MSGLNETKSTFETLEVWKKARELRKEISKLTKALPSDERFRLADQMIRASRSVTANIAEGHGRYHFQENIQFCRQARGSLYEVLDHLTVALDENYIYEEEFNILKTKIFVVIKILNGYISYLKKRKGME
ncbi:MAG TPA: four helix bundle protein [Candidatus Wunengus sp. YC61]|uniref:four helix bundle protein n=1 Tax=Candidatus Wunengus sp. YC61 TaxID=3367698 RepID=UPI004027896A